jgi:glycosyltransferase involved in cell wall biosynthesis
MRILMLTRYAAMAPSSRYRFLQFVPLLERHGGHSVEVRPMLSDEYLQALYHEGRRKARHLFAGYWNRGVQLRGLCDCDLVICEQEFLPYFPAFVETLIARRCPRLIVDYDDAAYYKYSDLPGLKKRIPALMAAAEAVVVGNRHLEEFARRHNRNVRVIPTVVDTTRYRLKQDYTARAGIKLVWIGTPVTAQLLRPIAPVLNKLRQNYPALQLRLIGSGDRLRDVLPFADIVEWSEAKETILLSDCDIGLMPLSDNDFTRGKCGLKLIQYMATGLPVVGSPVGANCEIITDGGDGFLAGQPKEWGAALERLITSENLRRDFGRNGAAKIRQRYSLEQGFDAWMSLIEPTRHWDTKSLKNAGTEVGP